METYMLYSLGLLAKKKERLEKKLKALFEDVREMNEHTQRQGIYDIHKEMEYVLNDLTSVIQQIEIFRSK